MNINELIEHIKSDNLAEAIAFQLSGTGYFQVKTRDGEKFQTVLTAAGDRPLMFTGRKEALAFVDNLVKQTLSAFNAPQQEPAPVPANAPAEGQLHVGVSTIRKEYSKPVDGNLGSVRIEVFTKNVDNQ
jgi:hypothetical protein